MRSIYDRLGRCAILCIAMGLAVASCGKSTEPKPNLTEACKDAGDAAKDFNDFLQDYPANLPAAKVALANMQSSLTVAGHNAANDPSGVFDAIQNAQQAIDTAQQALDDGKPVDTNSLRSAMDAIGNACSIALGG